MWCDDSMIARTWIARELGRTLHRRRADVLAYFDYRASRGPTEAINVDIDAFRFRKSR